MHRPAPAANCPDFQGAGRGRDYFPLPIVTS